MRQLPLFILLLFVSAHASAQSVRNPLQTPEEQTPLGMHHLSVTTEAARPEKKIDPMQEDVDKPVVPNAPAAKTEDKPAPRALPPKDAVKKLDTLTEWPYYMDLMAIGNDTALAKVIRAVDIDPGSVPPKGLLYIAKALSERKRYEEAAFYFYAGQLRATFDMARFPPYEANPKKKKKKDKRTQDQIGDTPVDPEIAMINPQEEISMLALGIGSPISRWAMADNTRLTAMMGKVQQWDLATPYAYLPDYDTSHAMPFETWPQLLTKARNAYFSRVSEISKGLNAVRPADPTPNFPRPQ